MHAWGALKRETSGRLRRPDAPPHASQQKLPRPSLLRPPLFFPSDPLQCYGAYYRKLSKKVQTELAEANSVAEEALSTMTTVKAHAAEQSTLAAYAAKLRRFYTLQQRRAGLYCVDAKTAAAAAAAAGAGRDGVRVAARPAAAP